MPLLNACATERVVTKTEVQKVPAALLSPCPKTSGAKSYRDAIELAEIRGKEIDECNARLKDIENWSNQ